MLVAPSEVAPPGHRPWLLLQGTWLLVCWGQPLCWQTPLWTSWHHPLTGRLMPVSALAWYAVCFRRLASVHTHASCAISGSKEPNAVSISDQPAPPYDKTADASGQFCLR